MNIITDAFVAALKQVKLDADNKARHNILGLRHFW